MLQNARDEQDNDQQMKPSFPVTLRAAQLIGGVVGLIWSLLCYPSLLQHGPNDAQSLPLLPMALLAVVTTLFSRSPIAHAVASAWAWAAVVGFGLVVLRLVVQAVG